VQVVAAGQLEELRTTVQNIAAEDAQLRAALLNDSKGTVSELVRLNTEGVYEVSDSLNVIVLEDSDKVLNIVIPSIDKIEGMEGEIAEFARALSADPKLLAALKASPRETIEDFMESIDGEDLELPTDRAIKVVIEQSDELCIVLSEDTAKLPDLVAASEIGAPSKFDPHMSCFTCECFTKASCFTGDCFTASSCFTWSSSGKC
jgi:hypothetical protein